MSIRFYLVVLSNTPMKSVKRLNTARLSCSDSSFRKMSTTWNMTWLAKAEPIIRVISCMLLAMGSRIS